MEDVKGLAKDLRELAMGALDSFQKNLIASKLNRVRQRRYPPSVTGFFFFFFFFFSIFIFLIQFFSRNLLYYPRKTCFVQVRDFDRGG